MRKPPSLMNLFLRRFIPSAFVLITSMLFLFQIDEQTHKEFLTQIGVRFDSKILGLLHEHMLNSLVPVGLLLTIFIMAMCILFSITHQRQIISENKQQDQLYKIQLLLDSTQEGIYGTDQNGCCTLANKACAMLLGYDSPDELLGKQMHDLMHHTRPDGTPYPAEECSAHKMSETGVNNVIENEVFWRKDGSSFPVSYNVLPMRIGRNAIGMVCSFIDITEKLQIEEQLRQAQKMEAVGQLSGGIAHDFNNILQIISNNTRFAMERFEAHDPVYTSLQEMLTAVERGTTLTRSMLAFSRKQFMRIRPLELNRIITDALVLGQKLVPENIKLIFHPCAEQLNVEADSTLMQQVLFNLITNARDAMPEGGSITVATYLVDPDPERLLRHKSSHTGKFARLTVTDQGSGIPEEIQNNIFDPFFTTKETGVGTGLGLSMVFGTIKQHDGFVGILSSSERGTTIAVCLPATE